MSNGFLRRVVAVGIFVLAAAVAESMAQVHLQLLTEDAIEARLRAYRGTDFDREAKLKKLFTESGCPADQLSEQIVKKKQPPNLICVLPGSSPEEIVVGAHFDHVDEGDGVVDNWSSASLLPSLLFSVRQDHRNYTYVFIGFMGEEQQLLGSEYYADHLAPERRQHIRAMVNMDTLGLGPTEVWGSHSDPTLAGLLGGMAKNLHLPLYAVNVEKVGTTDSESFARYKIPRITIHTLTQQTLPILHSRRDNLDKISMSDYYDSYKLIAAYLVALDQNIDRKPEAPAATGDGAKAQAH
jgi:hypothetical protein